MKLKKYSMIKKIAIKRIRISFEEKKNKRIN
jgi:hypothetical protein